MPVNIVLSGNHSLILWISDAAYDKWADTPAECKNIGSYYIVLLIYIIYTICNR